MKKGLASMWARARPSMARAVRRGGGVRRGRQGVGDGECVELDGAVKYRRESIS